MRYTYNEDVKLCEVPNMNWNKYTQKEILQYAVAGGDMNEKLEKIVTVTQNRSKNFEVADIIHVCKRLNNKKRDFLFVNSFQGKNVPMSPKNIFNLFDELVENIKKGIEKDEKVLVIGFAETATAIGHYVSINLLNCVYHMQTTREILENEKALVEFKEEHSHAPQHLLYGTEEIVLSCNRVLFVEDEITTGKTILNFIDKLKLINPDLKYAVASIVNWQDEQSTKKYEQLDIDTYFVVRGKIKDVHAKVNVETKSENVSIPCLISPQISYIAISITNFKMERCGNIPIKNMYLCGKYLYRKISQECNGFEDAKEIMVIGTEEFMFFPMLYAKKLEEHLNAKVKFQATTRSPIEVSEVDGYVLNERKKMLKLLNILCKCITFVELSRQCLIYRRKHHGICN